MTLVAAALAHRRALYVALALVLLLGVRSALTTARGIYPDVSFPRVAVVAEQGEAPVSGITIGVTRPLEEALGAVPGVMRLRSKTIRGACEIHIDFHPGTEMRDALAQVRAHVAATPLPAATALVVEQQTPALFPVLSFNVLLGGAAASDPLARARLSEWVEQTLRPRLASLPDAFRATVQSGDRREYVFEPDPSALARAGLDVLAVRDAIAQSNVVSAVGRAAREGLQYQLLVDGLLRAPEDVLAIAVPRAGAPVRLADLGELRETTAERTMVVTGGGSDGVVVSVFLRDGGRVTDLSRDVARVLSEIGPELPAGATVVPVYDQADLVAASIAGVGEAIGIGALLAASILVLFLRSARLTVVAGLSIPLSVVVTLAVLPLVGESLNLMSLGGLAIAVGFIIDDAIVVVESVARRLLHAVDSIPVAVAQATRAVTQPIVGSSLTTVVVFLPLSLLPGVVGQFFRSLTLALGISIVVSMVMSLVYMPLLLASPVLGLRGPLRERRWLTALQDRYARVVAAAIRRPGPLALALALPLLVGAGALRSIPSGFLPEMDEGGFVLDYALPVGTSLAETDATCRRIESVLLATQEIGSLSRRTGAELGLFATESNTGDILVGLRPRAERRRSVFAVMDGLRDRLQHEVPQAHVEFVQVMQDTIADLSGNPEPLEIKLLGAEYPVLQGAADRVELALKRIPGVVDVKNHVSFGSPELRWRPDRVAAARLGLSAEAIAAQVNAQLLGDVATRLQSHDRFVDVRVRYPDAWRANETDRADPSLFVRPASAAATVPSVPLAGVATFDRVLAESELERENQTPMVRVTAAVSGRDLGSAAQSVRGALRALGPTPGVRIEVGGQVASQEHAFARLLLVFGIAAGLVFLLLVLQFRSLRLPLVMFAALPAGQIGALHALRLCDVPLNVSSGMGLILLVGLVVKNGIILIEYAQSRVREGIDEKTAIVEAARVRLRPILMTSAAAVAGLLPLAAGIGAGSELQQPLAIAVIGGLCVSTVFGLLVLPIGCALAGRDALREEPLGGHFGSLAAESGA